MSVLRRGLVVAAAAASLALAPSSALAAAPLLNAAPEIVTIDAPAPGHHSDWSMTVRNVTDEVLPVGLAVAGADGPLTNGPAALEIVIIDDSGDTVLETGTAGSLLGTTIPLAPLDPGETRVLHGVASLPSEAGNEYQGVDGRLTFRFTAQVETAPSSPPTLSRTGAELGHGLVLLGTLLLGGTTLIIVERRRRSQHG